MFDGAGLEEFDAALIDAFTQKYPNITIEQRIEPDSVINTTFPRVVASENPPDLVRPQFGGIIENVEDGLLTNLDPYADAYGWDSLPVDQLTPYRVQDEARGAGSLYAFGAPAGPMTGVFYNRELAARIGMTSPPQTLAEFEALLERAKAAGITPIVAANRIGLLGHVWNLLLGNYMGAEALNKIGYRTPDAAVDTPEALQATQVLDRWIDAGYFNADLNALDQDPSYGQFSNGQALFTVQGSWVLEPLKPMVDAGNLGFFPLPPVEAGGSWTAMSSAGLTFAIPAKSTNHDAAAAFLNWLQSPEAAEVAFRTGFSAKSPDAQPVVAPLDADVVTQLANGYAKVVADSGITSWVVDATPGLQSAAVNPGLQQLAADQTTPEAFLESVQSAYRDEVGP
jgi:ABC-type glycerol-3-phosphate transport system substrate-binding protein